MNSYTESKLDTFILLWTGIEVSHSSKNSQTSTYCSLGIIFMGVRIAKVHEEPVTKQLGDVPVIAANHLRTGGLVGTDHFPVVFGIELAGKFGRVHQIAKHHGELPSFRIRRRYSWERCDLRGGLLLGCKRL